MLKHYRKIGASARKFARLHNSELNDSDLDEIRSWATPYFVQAYNSSRIADLEMRLNCASRVAARRAVCEFWNQNTIGNFDVATDSDNLETLCESQVVAKPNRLPEMIEAIGKLKLQVVANELANQRSHSEIAKTVGYKSESGVRDAIRQIKTRLARYEPQATTRTRLPDDTIEPPIVRAIRVAIVSAIREGKPTIIRERATLRIVNVYHAAPWAKQITRAKSTSKVDIAIPGEPQRALPELWAKYIGLGQGRESVVETTPNETAPNETTTTYWQSPYIEYLTRR